MPGTGQASARTDALLSQSETGKIGCVRRPHYGRLSPGMRNLNAASAIMFRSGRKARFYASM